MEQKLQSALDAKKDHVIIIDTFLHLDAFKQLSGMMTKEFIRQLPNEQLVQILQLSGTFKARLQVIVGYAESNNTIVFFETSVDCDLKEPLNQKEFTLDELFYSSTLSPPQYSVVERTIRKLVHYLLTED